jgi:hypothetical protein
MSKLAPEGSIAGFKAPTDRLKVQVTTAGSRWGAVAGGGGRGQRSLTGDVLHSPVLQPNLQQPLTTTLSAAQGQHSTS